jgi:adenylate cyclase
VSSLELVLLIVASVQTVLLVILWSMWLAGRRTQRRLRAKLRAAMQGRPVRRTSGRLIPTPDEVVKGVWETANLVRERGLGGAIRSSINDLAGWAQVERPDLVRLAGPDGAMSIMFSDIEGSTELNERLGDKAWVRLLAKHDVVVRKEIERQSGHIIKAQGDGFMVAFTEPEQAVRAAIGIQRAFDRTIRGGRTPVALRIGIHHGDVVHRDNDIFGRNVALAARVAAEANGREILVSEPVALVVEECEDVVLGEQRVAELKGLAGEHVITVVDWA